MIGLQKYFLSLVALVTAPAVLAAYGLWLVKRSPVPDGSDADGSDADGSDPDGSDAELHVPAACVVTTERTYRFPTEDPPTVARDRRIGRTLLVIGVGACLLFLAVIYLAVIGEGC